MNYVLNLFRTGGLIRQNNKQFFKTIHSKGFPAVAYKSNQTYFNSVVVYNRLTQGKWILNKRFFFHLTNASTNFEKGEVSKWKLFQKNIKCENISTVNSLFKNGQHWQKGQFGTNAKYVPGNCKKENKKEQIDGISENDKVSGLEEIHTNNKDKNEKWVKHPKENITTDPKNIENTSSNQLRTDIPNQSHLQTKNSKHIYNEREKKFLKINIFRNMRLLPLSKKYKDFLSNVKNKNAYRVLSKRIQLEKSKITSAMLKYQVKKGNFKMHFNEQIYRKAVIHLKKKVALYFKRNNKKSIMDIYYEEKNKYKLRKQRLFEMQEKIVKNSLTAQRGIKKFFKKYGYIGLTTYFLIFLVTFLSSFFCFHYKYISLADLENVSKKMHLNKYIDEESLQKKIDSLWGELICAYLAAKVSEPIRIIATIIITPYIQKLLKMKKKSRMI